MTDRSDSPLGPDDLSGARLRSALRGFDQLEVRALLNRAADRVRQLEHDVDRLRAQLVDAEARAAAVENLDDATLMEAVGKETARVLQSAREAAVDIRATAEADAAGIRSEAEGLVARERQRAETEADEILATAKADAQAEVDRSRAQGREMLDESRQLRKRVLADLARRRKTALLQIEQLRAGRDRLTETFDVVRRTVDEATRELSAAELAARLAAEQVVPPEPTHEADEAERALAELEEKGDVPPEGPILPSRRDREGGDDAPDTTGDVPVIGLDQPPASQPAPGGADDDASGSGAVEPAGPPVVSLVFDDTAVSPAAPGEGGPAGPDAGYVSDAGPGGGAGSGPETERRSSALRIIRAAPRKVKRPEPAAVPGAERPAATASYPPMVDDDTVEGVRIIAAEPPDATGVEEAPAAAAPAAEVVAPVTDAVAPAADGPLVAGEPASGEHDIDALFARIRADRESATAWAQSVLDSEEAQQGPGDVPSPASAASPSITEPTEPTDAVVAAEPAEGSEPTPAAEGAESAELPGGPGADALPEPQIGDALVIERPAVFAARDRVVEELRPQLVRKLGRTLADEQNEVLAAVRTAKGWPELGTVAPTLDEHRLRYALVAARFLDGAAREALHTTAGTNGSGPAVPSTDDLAEALAAAVVDPLRERLERALAAARSEVDGEGRRATASDFELGDRVSAVYREWKAQWLGGAATEQLVAAFARGVYEATPEGAPVRWMVDPAAGACGPDCEDNALADGVVRGGEFPTGHRHPPLHTACRCLVLASAS